jgi:hypothetical protein
MKNYNKMKNLIFTSILLLSIQFAFAQRLDYEKLTSQKQEVKLRPLTQPQRINPYADEIEVYVSVQNNLMTTNELYELFRGEHPPLNVYYISAYEPYKSLLTAEDAVYSSLESGFSVIRYKLPIKGADRLSFLVATVDDTVLKSKNLKIVGDFRPTFSCQEPLPQSNIFGLPVPGYVNQFFNDRKGCGYFKKTDTDKTYRFHIIPNVVSYDR